MSRVACSCPRCGAAESVSRYELDSGEDRFADRWSSCGRSATRASWRSRPRAGAELDHRCKLASLLILVLVVVLTACGGSAKPGVTNSAASNTRQLRQQWATVLADQTAFRACPPPTSCGRDERTSLRREEIAEARSLMDVPLALRAPLRGVRRAACANCVRSRRQRTMARMSRSASRPIRSAQGRRSCVSPRRLPDAVRELALCIKAAA